ncbi:MAG: type II toxin-antitoxin system Phd/YefM family antitoxin [Planctomycetes bacterium]|nr:type II toxin-antitoxin system Phd/YefM family antitoxin [Planctomycetota bacterium]
MKFATVREAKSRFSEMIRLAAKGKRVLVTSHGKPVAMIQGMTEDEIEDYVISTHPALRASIEQASRDVRRGRGIPAEKVLRQLEAKARREKQRDRLRR